MSAAAVQPLTLQPLALAQPGTDVSAAAEEQADHKYTSSSNAHGFCFNCAIRLIVLYLPICRFVLLAVGRNCRR